MTPTDRLYYHDSFLYHFEAQVLESMERHGRRAVVLDRTAFYPTSGGQLHDTGSLRMEEEEGSPVAVVDVEDGEEDGKIYQFLEEPLAAGARVHGAIDAVRRRDHIQQHSGQHLLSAALIHLFQAPTVSFHMGAESCTIDLAAKSLSPAQIAEAERLSNETIAEDRPVTVRFVPLEEAKMLGLRKLPPKQTGQLRLVDIADFDLTACGGTHVRSTGQIGAILLRKTENVKQGVRLEFVCGLRAVAAARQDYTTLTEAAALYSAHPRDVTQQVRKSLQEARSAAKQQQKLAEELAELETDRLLAQSGEGPCLLVKIFPERDASFIKRMAQKITAARPGMAVWFASGVGQPALVFAQGRGGKFNMGQCMKEAMAKLGGRGGGNADLAQGGLSGEVGDISRIEQVLRDLEAGQNQGHG